MHALVPTANESRSYDEALRLALETQKAGSWFSLETCEPQPRAGRCLETSCGPYATSLIISTALSRHLTFAAHYCRRRRLVHFLDTPRLLLPRLLSAAHILTTLLNPHRHERHRQQAVAGYPGLRHLHRCELEPPQHASVDTAAAADTHTQLYRNPQAGHPRFQTWRTRLPIPREGTTMPL